MTPTSRSLSPRPSNRALAASLLCGLLLLAFGAVASNAGAAVGEFQNLTSSPSDLTSVTVNPATNIVYAQENGGRKYFSFDPRTNVWTELAEAPINSGNNGGAAFLNGKIYTSYTNESTNLGVYDIASNTWTTLANPLKEGTANITVVGDEIYMVNDRTFVKYNPATSTTTPLAEAPEFKAGDCSGGGFERWGGLQPYQGKIFGHQGDGCVGFAVYDIAANTWTELPPVPSVAGVPTEEEEEEGEEPGEEGGATAGSALDPTTGTYYTYGAYGEHHFYIYDIASKTWTSAVFPFEVEDGGMAYVAAQGLRGIYAIEGESGTGFTRYITPEPVADLSVSAAASVSSVKIGGEVSYTLHVANAGPNESGATLSDVLPGNLSFVSATSSQGSCSGTTTVTCALGGLASGASATVTITAKATSAGAASDTASVTADVSDPNAANNSATASVTVEAPPAVCRSARVVTIHWKTGPKLHLKRIAVTVNGTPALHLKGKARKATVNLAGRGPGTYLVKITGTARNGKRYSMKRTYHLCSGHAPGNESKSLFLSRH